MSLAGRYVPRWAQRGAILQKKAADKKPRKEKERQEETSTQGPDNARASQQHQQAAASQHQELDEASKRWVKLLRRCSCLEEARYVHRRLEAEDPQLYRRRTTTCNALIEIYGKCSGPNDALLVFDRLLPRNAFTFRFAIRACLDNGSIAGARRVVEAMRDDPVAAEQVSCSSVVSAIATPGDEQAVQEAKEFFDQIPGRDSASYTALLAAYTELGQTKSAALVFHKMPQWTLAAKNRMVIAYAEAGHLEEAGDVYESMESRNLAVGMAMLKILASNGRADAAKKVFRELREKQMDAWNLLLKAVARAGEQYLDEACRLFDKGMPRRDSVSWTTMLQCYIDREDIDQAAFVLKRMPSWESATADSMRAALARTNRLEEAPALLPGIEEKLASTEEEAGIA